MCAGGQLGEDACFGDGGGPLVCPLKQDPQRYVQVNKQLHISFLLVKGIQIHISSQVNGIVRFNLFALYKVA